jgi:hypothetical protein
MTIVATITTDTGTVLSLDKFLTGDGRVPDFAQVVEEELTANGVDGRRFRTVSNRYPEFTAAALETAATYAAAVTRCRIYDGMVGQNVKLQITNLGGSTVYNYLRVHVKAATPRAVPGTVAGSASGASHVAHIEASLTMVIMEIISGSNP